MIKISQENDRRLIFVTILLLTAVALLVGPTDAFAQESADNWNRSVLSIPQPEFNGKMGLRSFVSVLDFPAEVQGTEGRAEYPADHARRCGFRRYCALWGAGSDART